ncbi:hypothetical protein NQ317_001183 [Molorchus minor]|uniref:Uncharacterized protein n=1 Tax=Molorchus minor TaxID=1323400 RepID=A0ABQ9J263_9CUCU|nr:hypothetical protein NQ317_001183 [Molorchus minor]
MTKWALKQDKGLMLFYHYALVTGRWRTRLYKDILFHWIFFYITRIWFLFLKFGRYIITTLDYYIEMTCEKRRIIY